MIYLDYAATTPMSEEALAAYNEVARSYPGNASSIHDAGSSAQKVVNAARTTIAKLLNAKPRGLFFTGSGSEANSLAIQALVLGNQKKGNHIISTGAEHSCIRYTMQKLKKQGFEISEIKLHNDGTVDLDHLKELITDKTILLSIHHGNAEIGTLQNLKTIGDIAEEHNVLFHSDCVQTFGKVPVDVEELKLDSLSISGHKIYGPKGVGAAYISPNVRWKPTLPGTTQEKGFRPGTVDTPAVAAFATAAKQIVQDREEEFVREKEIKKYLVERIKELPFDISLEGNIENSLPGILGLRIHGMEGQYVMLECNRHGLAISTGSACSVGTEKRSATMACLDRTEQEALEFIRLSIGKNTTKKEIDRSAEILNKVLTQHFNMVQA
ncbi:MAG: IscS subfamily cysteine desulfurase [Balneolaceae bacterium]|nr:IscS subfamily cysteine desulfurase [Balneolaceae bacterium]